MKQLLLLTILVFPSIVSADEFIQMSNGMTCWRNNNGHTYGCSGGTSTGDSGFNDVRTGERYEYTGGNQSVNTRSGQFMNTPQRNNNEQDYGYDD